ILGGLMGLERAADALEIGEPAPDFQCRDDRDRLWDSRDHYGKKPLVVFFYQSDFSFNCTQQAQRYRDFGCEMDKLGVEVVVIDGDGVAADKLFKGTHELNLSLLSDVTGDVARKFDVPLRLGEGGKAMARNAQGEPVIDPSGRPVSFPRNVTAS